MNTSLFKILFGNIAMILCSAFYLIWWSIAFKPGGSSTSFSTICIILAFITGIGGIILASFGISFLSCQEFFSHRWIIAIAGATYVTLFIITWKLLKRPVTSELAIILIWGVFECCILNVLYGYYFWKGTSFILFVIVLGAVIVNMFYYVRYYNLPMERRYYEGMMPLAIDGSITLLITLSMALIKKPDVVEKVLEQ